jgi:hypothetical protein
VRSDDDDIDQSERSEAEAQREETVMPWIWGAIGLLAILGFVVWFALWPSLGQIREPPAAAPIYKPPAQHD